METGSEFGRRLIGNATFGFGCKISVPQSSRSVDAVQQQNAVTKLAGVLFLGVVVGKASEVCSGFTVDFLGIPPNLAD